jgi:hypothetical protein
MEEFQTNLHTQSVHTIDGYDPHMPSTIKVLKDYIKVFTPVSKVYCVTPALQISASTKNLHYRNVSGNGDGSIFP